MRKPSALIGSVLALLLPAFALAAQADVTLETNSISPYTVTVNAGDTVVWSNDSSTDQSTVTADDGAFQSGLIAPGGQFAATFNTSGTYNYYDNASGGAVLGIVSVEGTSITTPAIPQTPQTISTPGYYVNPNVNYQYATTPTSSVSRASLTAEVQSLIAEN